MFQGPKGIPKLPTIESLRPNATVYLLMLVIIRFTSSFITPTVGALGKDSMELVGQTFFMSFSKELLKRIYHGPSHWSTVSLVLLERIGWTLWHL
jgi:hypothetical protein